MISSIRLPKLEQHAAHESFNHVIVESDTEAKRQVT